MAHLYRDPYHLCPFCHEPTENRNLCDSCLDNLSFILHNYESKMSDRQKLPEPDDPEHDK